MGRSSWLVKYLLLCFVVQADGFLTDNAFKHCNEFFYEKTPPRGIKGLNVKFICQSFENKKRYATLYNTDHRIPLYSAYTIDTSCNDTKRPKISFWFIEPQLSHYAGRDMSHLNHPNPVNEDEDIQLKEYQAVNLDYHKNNLKLDKGHMNPSSYQCEEGADATFTLTNAVPQKQKLNNGPWNKEEQSLKNRMKNECKDTPKYVVTGAVPGKEKLRERVTIPEVMWAAACCLKKQNSPKMFRFAYIADNKEGATVRKFEDVKKSQDGSPIARLQKELKDKYNDIYGHDFEIFMNSCQYKY